MQWSDRIGRRVKLRDLHVLLAVAQSGSIARAAETLAISHPVVSRTVSDLEHVLGVRLFDRTPRGVEPTIYGRAFLDCGTEVFDDLRRGVRRIEFLADPTTGEVRVGGTEPIMAEFVPAIMSRLSRQYPRLHFQLVEGDADVLRASLRERRIDLVISRRRRPATEEDLESETLFDEQMLIVTGPESPWLRRRKVKFDDLLTERWVLPLVDAGVGQQIAEGISSTGASLPAETVFSNSIPLRINLLLTGNYISVLPHSMLHFGAGRLPVKILPVKLPGAYKPVEMTIVKSRTLSPIAHRFIDCARVLAKQLPNRHPV